MEHLQRNKNNNLQKQRKPKKLEYNKLKYKKEPFSLTPSFIGDSIMIIKASAMSNHLSTTNVEDKIVIYPKRKSSVG